MPNSCNSILKNIFYTLIIFLSASCASIKNDNNLFIYTGKLLINQNNTNQLSFNLSVKLSKKDSIIQIKKPFYGNVLKIKVTEGKDLIFLPTENSYPFYVPKEINRNFKYWLKQCLLSNKLNINSVYDEIVFDFKCIKENNRTNFYISYQDFTINGFVIKK